MRVFSLDADPNPIARIVRRAIVFCMMITISSCFAHSSVAQDAAVKERPKQEKKKKQTDEEREAARAKAKAERAKKRAEKKKRVAEFADFMRVREDRRGRPVRMETSVTRYIGKNEKGETVSVDLIGVVHIGEKEYYEKLNDLFKPYDGMLYELVAPEGTVIPKGGRAESGGGMNPVAGLQKMMQGGLGLEFQLEHIDYTRKNFVHADMTPEEFAESMAKNNESVGRMFKQALSQSIAQSAAGNSGVSDTEMLMALMSSNREIKLRRIMAEQMQNMEGSMAVFEGDSGSTIIDYRNAKCMEILKREMNSGKKKLAIFYGAGHLPDMQRRLQSDFKMKRGGQYWLEAWNLDTKKKKKKSDK